MMQKTAVAGSLLAALWLAPSVVRAVPCSINVQGWSDLGDLVVTPDGGSPIDATEDSSLRRAEFAFDPPARVDSAIATLPSFASGVVHLFDGRLLEGGVRFAPSDVGPTLANSPESGGTDSSAPIGAQVHAPEPATVILLGLGLASLSARRLTSRKR